jgi:hypothetical protein
VVVKRMHDSPPIAEDVSFVVAGKAARFDVYVSAGAVGAGANGGECG